MLQSTASIPEMKIRGAVEAAFRSMPVRHQSIWSRFMSWLGSLWSAFWEWFGSLLSAAARLQPFAVLMLTVLVLAVIAAGWVIIASWRGRAPAGAAGRPWSAAEVLRGDPWAAAQQLAAAGDFTAAAHALYAALLESAARGQQVRLHPSKTVGDYARELRGRQSRLFPGFREFAGDYEVVIYGDQSCDRDRYDRLFHLAVPLLSANG